MPRVIIVFAIVLASFSVLHSGAVTVHDAPTSIQQAFLETHPFASHALYRFSTDDAGPFFQVEFEESGTHQSAEFRYTDQNWLMDAGKWLSEETPEDSLAARETTLTALESDTHKR